jgi:hypothetical protein
MRRVSSGASLASRYRIFRDVFRVQLGFDPVLQAHLADLIDVGVAGAEGETVEGMEDFLVVRHLRDGGDGGALGFFLA